MESVQQQSFPITEARLITTASPPTGASGPRTMFVLVAGAAGGMVLGFGLGMLREMSDRVFRTSDQVASILHTDCLAVLPKVTGPAPSRSNEPRTNYGALDYRVIKRDQSLFWSVVDSPFSRFAEAMRAIKIAADLHKSLKPSKVVGITSSLPNEGKTTTSMALAQSIANAGGRVVLLDADLRNPGLSRKLTPHLVDSFVFVIEWGRTKIDVVEHVLGSAQGVYDNLLGVVLNKANLNILSRYETHRGDYYYNRYYTRYGYVD
jgi:succinoglycan biosynthesis transport protein ExoP